MENFKVTTKNNCPMCRNSWEDMTKYINSEAPIPAVPSEAQALSNAIASESANFAEIPVIEPTTNQNQPVVNTFN